MLSGAQRRFVESMRVARLATADANGAPHVVPVCYALIGDNLYVTIDEKPKRPDVRAMKRLRNIEANPHVAVVVDRYDEDWSRLAWVMLRGRADVLDDGDEHDRAQAGLRERYPQYRAMRNRTAAGHRGADAPVPPPGAPSTHRSVDRSRAPRHEPPRG